MNEDIERPADADDARREAVEAADDTGLVVQQEFLHAVGDEVSGDPGPEREETPR